MGTTTAMAQGPAFPAGADQPKSKVKILGNVFGGGNEAAVEGNTKVNIIKGQFAGEIFGGGNGALNNDGTVKASADIGKHNADGTLVENTGDTQVNITGGEIIYVDAYPSKHNIYGGGNLACNVAGDTHVTMTKGMVTWYTFLSNQAALIPQWYAWYDQAMNSNTQKSPICAVFGAGYGVHTDVACNTNVKINIPGTADIHPSGSEFTTAELEAIDQIIMRWMPDHRLVEQFVTAVHGGGYDGTVGAYDISTKGINYNKDSYLSQTNVTIEGQPFIYHVFGGGLGSPAGANGDVTSKVGTIYGGTKVNIQGGIINGEVFGGGAGIMGTAEIPNPFGGGGTVNLPYTYAGQVMRETDITINGSSTVIFGNVYGGGDIANTGWHTPAARPTQDGHQDQVNQSLAHLDYTTSLNLLGGNILGKVFGGGNGRKKSEVEQYRFIGTVVGSTNVNVNGSKIWSTIYGGGNTGCIFSCQTVAATQGLTGRSIAGLRDGCTNVTIRSGLVAHDIFGGGYGDDPGTGEENVSSADITGNTYVYFHQADFEFEKYWKPRVVADAEHMGSWGNPTGEDTGTFPAQQNAGIYRNTESDIAHNLYGGGNIACTVGGNTHVYMDGAPTAPANFSSTDYYRTAIANVAKPHFSVFGGGFGAYAKVTGQSYSDINLAQGTGLHSIIGGGMNGPVGGICHVHVGSNTGSLIHHVYGGGYYAPCQGTVLDITRGNILENVFGGAVMGNINADGNLADIATKTTIGLQTGATLNLTDEDGATIRSYTQSAHANQIIIGGNVYGANDVSGAVHGIAQLNIYGGTVRGNVYGAGNGDHIGYYVPGELRYDLGAHANNYYAVDHSADHGTVNATGPKGNTYVGRPQTLGGVNLTLAGNSESERVTVLGQVFGGGNSCTIGQWNEALLNDAKYHGNPHLVRDDPDYFQGGGTLNISLGSHLTIGQTNDALALDSPYRNEDGDNVSGFYLGCSGAHLATQDKAKTDNYYHHYYDTPTAKYWPGFVVYADGGSTPLTRDEGIRSFNAYLNNILVWTDDVNLTFADGAEDIFLANFVGGGFRGSMKTKTASKKFVYTLPEQVTVGNMVIGGAYNTDVVYHIFRTTDGHIYTESDGHYEYLTDLGGLTQGQDYDLVEYGATDNVKGIIRFRYDGGILSSNGSNVADFVTLNLNNKFVPGSDKTKARVFGGCFASGIIQGDAVINYSAGDAATATQGAYDVYGGGALADIGGNTKVNLLGGVLTNAYGGGLGRLADKVKDYAPVAALVQGNTTVQLGTNDGTASSIVKGYVFGANNVNGTPKGHAYVHVLRTTPQPGAAGGAYHVAAVYGGGNKAGYMPTSDTEFSEVLVENCYNSIEYVYGGGNAACSPATQVTIRGGKFYDIFAGGNGAGADNPGADVGYYDFTWDAEHSYGAGTSDAYIYSGVIADGVFGGSNTKGNVRTRAEVHIDDLSEETGCDFVIGEIYGAGNEAYMDGSSAIDLGCVPKLGVLYGGAKNADMGGNITLNITSGTFGKIFGGNNLGGRIMGNIIVNIDETGCYPIKIDELYTCGNQAAYSVYGYNDDKTPKLSGTRQYADPQLNIYSCTSIGKVFGGGLGTNAVVAGNTNVNIQQIPGRYASKISGNLGTIGTVFGGGNQAKVEGGTNIYVANSPTKVQHALPYYNGTNGGHTGSEPTDETEYDAGANITGNVYGGGNQADVSGKTNVTIGR